MLLKTKDVIGLPVITIKGGEKTNKVKDILYNTQNNSVQALIVDMGSWFGSPKVILIQDIKSIGKDAVTIEDETKISEATDNIVDTESTRDPSQETAATIDKDFALVGNRIMTDTGKDLGKIIDLYFEFPNGEVTKMEISRSVTEDLISGTKVLSMNQVISIGKDCIIVKDEAYGMVENQQITGGVQKTMQDIKTTVVSAGGSVMESGEETKKGLEQNWEENQGTIQEKLGDVGQKAQGAFEKIKETVTEKSNEFQDRIKEQRLDSILGKTLKNVTLLTDEDDIIAVPGDIITHKIIEEAKQNGRLDQLLNNVESLD
jgi:uncharacterized protein YrrD